MDSRKSKRTNKGKKIKHRSIMKVIVCLIIADFILTALIASIHIKVGVQDRDPIIDVS